MKQNKPLKRTEFKRDPKQALEWQQRTQKALREKKSKKRKAVKRVSKKRALQNSDYSTMRIAYLERNPYCVPCHDGGLTTLAGEIHHMAGREGDRLCDSTKFLAVCRHCHEWIEANPMDAMLKGYSLSRHRSGGKA